VTEPVFEPLLGHPTLPDEEMARRARAFLDVVSRRRTVRSFSERPVPRAVLEDCLRAAGRAPSGANLQPWRFVVVQDAALKRAVREAAEREEKAFYERRAPPEWLAALAPLGTDWRKPFLEAAPALVAVFAERHGVGPDGRALKRYYVDESVGLACGFLILALHHAGLATLTHTPSPMGFLNELLGRPPNERAYLLLVVGHPAPDATVPRLERKALADFVEWR
jgi:nitroreductase